MRFGTRTFLVSFVPFAFLLAVSFWVVRQVVVSAVREELRNSSRQHQIALTREQTANEARTRRLLTGVVENSSLKAGLQLLATEPSAQDEARNTVRDQLSEIGDSLDYDLMIVSGVHGEPLAAMVRESGGFVPLNSFDTPSGEENFFRIDDRIYDLISVPVSENGSQVATLTVGGRFDISRLGTPAVLLNNGLIVAGETRELATGRVEAALRKCSSSAECLVRIQDQMYFSLPLKRSKASAEAAASTDNGYMLRSLQNVDAASAEVQIVVQRLFMIAGILALLAALGISALSSRSVARPLAELAARLRQSSATGEFPEFPQDRPSTLGDALEIRDLMQGFNLAAQAVREGRERLTRAYVEFVGSMAQALDARDSYTAGHSRRVSEYSCAIAKAMDLPAKEIETIRVGALLHDVGKIGISDLVLQKPGRLTPEENELIRQHPSIGRRILEKVNGMEPYLNMVELHHENWDGTGYPRGLKQGETPLQARIVKVADAYDAMTSDRPYRRGMTHADALEILRRVAGTETDVNVVGAFAGLGDLVKEQAVKQGAVRARRAETDASLQILASAIEKQANREIPENVAEPTEVP